MLDRRSSSYTLPSYLLYLLVLGLLERKKEIFVVAWSSMSPYTIPRPGLCYFIHLLSFEGFSFFCTHDILGRFLSWWISISSWSSLSFWDSCLVSIRSYLSLCLFLFVVCLC